MVFNKDNEFKSVIKKAKKQIAEIKKIELNPEELDSILQFINLNKKKYDNEIPLHVMSEELDFDYDQLTAGIMQLILSKDLIGFINDRETEDKSDDILILRDERLVDKMNEYRIE